MNHKGMYGLFFLIVFMMSFPACMKDVNVMESNTDMILYNAYVYPITGKAIENGAVVIKDGKIISFGSSDAILQDWKGSNSKKINCEGRPIPVDRYSYQVT